MTFGLGGGAKGKIGGKHFFLWFHSFTTENRVRWTHLDLYIYIVWDDCSANIRISINTLQKWIWVETCSLQAWLCPIVLPVRRCLGTQDLLQNHLQKGLDHNGIGFCFSDVVFYNEFVKKTTVREQGKNDPPRKLTWNPTIDPRKRRNIYKVPYTTLKK